MNKYIVIVFIAAFIISCRKEKDDEISPAVKEETGTVWLSGGLDFCATQIRLDFGDTLIPVNTEKILALEMDQRIRIKYVQIEKGETRCKVGKDCVIINVLPID
jgi:hypothetical protein